MATIKLDVPYLAWRDGRPRWVPGPKLRAGGFKGRDLKDEFGQWLPFEAAVAAARALNAEVAAAKGGAGRRLPPARGRTVKDLLDAYFASEKFGRLEPATRVDYKIKANVVLIERRNRSEAQKRDRQGVPTLFSKAPAAAIGKPETLAFFEHLLRDGRSIAVARGAIMVLSAAYQWATTSTAWRLRDNPCHELDLPSPPPRLRIATDAEIRALDAAATALGRPSVGDAIYLALFTGQRQADVLHLIEPFGENRSLVERVASGEPIRFLQRKTGARVGVFATTQLAARLAEADARRRRLKVVPEAIVVDERTGDAYGGDAFRRLFADVRALAITGDEERALAPCPSLADFRFQDLRDTAVTWLARAGATLPQIAAITGHSMKGIHTILKHYLELDEGMAREAITKLQAWIDLQDMKL